MDRKGTKKKGKKDGLENGNGGEFFGVGKDGNWISKKNFMKG